MSTKLQPLPKVQPGARYFDAHCHLCRADTSTLPNGKPTISPNASLVVKQNAVRELHESPFYTEDNLYMRMRSIIERKIQAGERGMNAVIDCTPDIGDRAFRVALQLRAECQEVGYELNVYAYALWGFKHWASEWHETILSVVDRAQGLTGLPERDDRPGHAIGFDGHLNLLINLAVKHGLPLQIHTDQTNTPMERGTERLVDAVHWLVTSSDIAPEKRPRISAVHGLSIACYPDEQRDRLIYYSAGNNVDYIVCPWATAGNRQIGSLTARIHNSIAPVGELLLAEIPVSIGTDNINDIFVKRPKSPLLAREFDQLCTLIRYDDDAVVEKLFAGELLDDTDRASLREWQASNLEAYASYKR